MNVKKFLSLSTVALALTVFSDYSTVPQLQTQKLKNIPTSTLMPTNLVPVVNRLKDNQSYLFDRTYYIDVDYKHAWLGYFPSNLNSESSINICPRWDYPSYTRGAFNINLGIDNDVCFNPSGDYNRYSVAIGTTVKIAKQHGYGFGSQINSFNANSTVIGYGASAVHDCSTVIGQGTRPNGGSSSYDKKFTSWAQADTFLKTLTANVFKGLHFEVKTEGTNTLYTITAIRSTPDENGYYYDYLETPDTGYYGDYEPGQYDWRYGKSHGKGTFNIVAVDKTLKASPGLKAVYINDDCLYDLVTGVAGDNVNKRLTLTPAQIDKGITFTKNGYDQNSAVEIGNDAIGSIKQSYVDTLNKAVTLRNVSVAIGARAVAIANNGATNTGQSVAIGYCANAEGGQSVAIGSGAKHLDDETDITGHNAYASGSTSIAIGYSSKATGAAAVSLGSGKSGGASTIASGDQSIALGHTAQATASGAVQIGAGTNSEENTLKFQNVTIVKDGKIAGFDESALDPVEHDISGSSTEETSIQVKPHVINSITSTNDLGPGSELGLEPTGSRNYEIFVPNDPEIRAGLPIVFEDELPSGLKCLYKCDKFQIKLPLTMTVRQPTKKYVLVNTETIEDDYDWTPVVTNCNYVFSTSQSKFVAPTGKKPIEGYNLHCATNIVLSWFTGDGTVPTRKTIATITGKQTHLDVTFFKYADPPSDTTVSTSEYPVNGTIASLYYSSRNGTAEKFDFTVSVVE